jgi:acetylornithine deacetylase
MMSADRRRAEGLEQTLSHLRALVAFDTQNPPRSITAADDGLFAWFAGQLPGEFDVRIDDHGEGCVSLLAVRGTPDLLFNVHMDTVPGTRRWQRDPLALSVEGDRAYGLGACDIKGAAACLLVAAQTTSADMALLLTSDEEAGDNRCVARFLQSDHPFREVVVAEPTHCQAVLAHRGIVSLQGAFTAAAGHSSEPRALRDNALHQASRWVAAATDWAEEQRRSVHFDALSGVCFNVGTISGGIKNNVIAPGAEVRFGLRPLPGQEPDALVQALQALHQGEQPVEWEHRYAGPALPGRAAIAAAGGIEQAMAASSALAERLGLPIGPAVNFWTEAALFSAAGLPALVFGPGAIAQAHCADEWVALEQLERALAHYRAILARDPSAQSPGSVPTQVGASNLPEGGR